MKSMKLHCGSVYYTATVNGMVDALGNNVMSGVPGAKPPAALLHVPGRGTPEFVS
jgi:hypothetical protein